MGLPLIGQKPSLTHMPSLPSWDLKSSVFRKAFPVSTLKPTCCNLGSGLFVSLFSGKKCDARYSRLSGPHLMMLSAVAWKNKMSLEEECAFQPGKAHSQVTGGFMALL